MNVHQVITGALNRTESAFAVGSVEGINFTACAVGCDVVILAADFQRVQIIPEESAEEITCIDCCSDTGKIAAGYGNRISIYEATPLRQHASGHGLDYRWFQTAALTASGPVLGLSWNLEGMRLLLNDGAGLELWEQRDGDGFHLGDSGGWESVWEAALPNPLAFLKYSPDGSLFATAAKNDRAVRIWYPEGVESEGVSFAHTVLTHPRNVVGFEWRHTGRYMPRHSIPNALLTWCDDNICRLWIETAFPNDVDSDENIPERSQTEAGRKVRKKHHFGVKNVKSRIMSRLKHLQRMKEKNKQSVDGNNLEVGGIQRSASVLSFDDNFCDSFFAPVVHFHLAASINAETDCFLVPSMEAASVPSIFAVHWLNNKELVFSLGAEKLLSEALAAEQRQSPKPAEHGESGSPDEVGLSSASSAVGAATPSTPGESRVSLESGSGFHKDALDVRLEELLREWSGSSDVLFTLHPIDASLLVWTVEWLDDASRGAVLSFSSRLPAAFPLTDASSLCHNQLLTFNPHWPRFVHLLHPETAARPAPPKSSKIFLLSNHENGSLNLWDVELEDHSRFTTILNITHRSRMCGHRFRINRVICHPVLPLLLTTSHNTRPPGEAKGSHGSELILWKVNPVGPLCQSGGVRELSRINSTQGAAFRSVAWIPATLPSSSLGSVCNSPSSCFVASDGGSLRVYQAVLDARALLSELAYAKGAKMTRSMSSDSSSGPESPEKSPDALASFVVVSNQSSARPGCILELQNITQGSEKFEEVVFLHVYPEHMVLGSASAHGDEGGPGFHERFYVVMLEKKRGGGTLIHTWLLDIASQQPSPYKSSKKPSMVEGTNFYPSAPKTPAPSTAQLFIRAKKVVTQPLELGSEPGGVPVALLEACSAAGHLPSANLHSACQVPYLFLTAGTDDHVRMWKCDKDAEGTFSWSEWGLISGRGADGGSVETDSRLLSLSAAQTTRFAGAFSSAVGVSGAGGAKVLSIDVGVWECESTGGTEWVREDTIPIPNIPVPKAAALRRDDYEFQRAPRTPLGSVLDGLSAMEGGHFLRRIPSIPSASYSNMLRVFSDLQLREAARAEEEFAWMVQLDWVSTEDGSHILTVGVGAKILLYALASEDAAQQNLVMMIESAETHKRGKLQKASSIAASSHRQRRLVRWRLVRSVDLHSADGQPPVPMMLSWVRDGILVVGMESEMRVYNQWKMSADAVVAVPETPKAKQPVFAITTEEADEADESVAPLALPVAPYSLAAPAKLGLTITPSASALDLARKGREGSVTPGLTKHKHDFKKSAEGSDGSKDSASIADIIREEGVFEAARLASPALPQYHPKQLMELLNSGKIRRVKETYDELFTGAADISAPAPDDLDAFDDASEEEEEAKATPRRASMAGGGKAGSATTFTAKHNRILTRFLTHLHLPGLSSVDQMHLLAVADTISSFSPDVMDKLAQANAGLKGGVGSGGVLESSSAGYASAGVGVETVDECGLRFLMAMKQHEYLLRCLPMKDRRQLAQKGLSSCHVAWALQSETETELLNSIPALRQDAPSWASLRALGIGWWLQDVAKLRTCVEKMAKAAFQKKSDPMDAALFYLAMKKKNVLTHLFKSVSDKRMMEFFREDFETDKWKKAALKNAFVLMGKQRFQHAVAFFLLGGSLHDAIQTCLVKLEDIQLAIVVIRLYEPEPVQQSRILSELLCKEVLGLAPAELGLKEEDVAETAELEVSASAHPDPFLRSMALWHLKQYAKAAATLLDEGRAAESSPELSAIFNFYAFLRCHPMVIRQRLDASGVQIGSTEKFIMVARELGARITPGERRLYFRAACGHFQSGCPLLALDVLSRLPKHLSLVIPGSSTMSSVVSAATGDPLAADAKPAPSVEATTGIVNDAFDWGAKPALIPPPEPTDMDWGAPVITNGAAAKAKRPPIDDLDLAWSDEEEAQDSELESPKVSESSGLNGQAAGLPNGAPEAPLIMPPEEMIPAKILGPLDTMAQQLKFIACLKILMEELGTLATGFDVDGGVLRFQLYSWLEMEIQTLKTLCDYSVASSTLQALAVKGDMPQVEPVFADPGLEDEEGPDIDPVNLALHQVIREDTADMRSRWEWTRRKRRWLGAHADLLRTFASYCALHGQQGVGLASARMELLLLMLELHQEESSRAFPAQTSSFPLLAASVASYKTDLAGPILFIQSQTKDLLTAISELTSPPSVQNSLPKVYLFYNLGQCLSACIYESLSDIERVPNLPPNTPGARALGGGFLLRRRRRATSYMYDEMLVATPPSKWPGVQNMMAVLTREAEESGPSLLLLLLESFAGVYLALFSYAFTAYDSRWLFRLMAHPLDSGLFAAVFGGGGENRNATCSLNTTSAHRPPPPPRPARPPPPRDASPANLAAAVATKVDPANIRAKFHAKVFGPGPPGNAAATRKLSTGSASAPSVQYNWCPPKKSIHAFFSDKPLINLERLGMEYDSDDSVEEEAEDDEDDYDDSTGLKSDETPEHLNPEGYAWTILRLAMVRHALGRLGSFFSLAGLEAPEIPVSSPRAQACLKTLQGWETELRARLEDWDGGCPLSFLPKGSVEGGGAGVPSLHKYRTILEAGNTPFEGAAASALPVKRLWLFLVRQEGLTEIFIRYIFKSARPRPTRAATAFGEELSCDIEELPEPLKLVQREQDPITAFAVSNVNPGWIVVSTGRELQEMDISAFLRAPGESGPIQPAWMTDPTELDIALAGLKRDPLRDNDDYLLLNAGEGSESKHREPAGFNPRANSFLCKRQVGGIRRMQAHPSLPYYVSGGSDGSVKVWEWGTQQPLCSPRNPGTFGKISGVHFNLQGNKFGVTDRDGVLSLWQLGSGMSIRKAFFQQHVHSKSAGDFTFLGSSSSLLASVGIGDGGHNLALWDTLLPAAKACVATFQCHVEGGGECVAYAASSQTLITGGKNGEMCLWDVRQRQQRNGIKVFEHSSLKTMRLEGETLVTGSGDGDVKVWALGSAGVPALVFSLPGQHAAKSGFTLRNVGSGVVQGVQCIVLEHSGRLFTCGADATLKLRQLPALPHLHNF